MTKTLKRFAADEAGATSIEYGLIATIIALVIVTALTTLGTNLGNSFNRVAKLK